MKGDVTVFGITMGQYVIEDIRVIVPQHEVVVIPADKAFQSRDLWRAINQRKVFQLHAGTKTWPNGQVPPAVETAALADQNKMLEQALADQKAQNAAVLEAMAEQSRVIQQLMQTVTNLRVAPGASAPEAPQTDVPSADAPMYVPSTVKPDVKEQRIKAQQSSSDASGVDNARSKLRAFRKKR
jgi:hypothetical protein